jgi:hypothetical protein
VLGMQGEGNGARGAYVRVSKGFSVFALFKAAIVVGALAFMLGLFCVHDVWFARRVLRQDRLRLGRGHGRRGREPGR